MVGSAVAGSIAEFSASQFRLGENDKEKATQLRYIDALIELIKDSNELTQVRDFSLQFAP